MSAPGSPTMGGRLRALLRPLFGPPAVDDAPVVAAAPASPPRTAAPPAATPVPVPTVAATARAILPPAAPSAALALDADPSVYATRARQMIAQLRDAHAYAVGAADVRDLLLAIERDPIDAVRQLPGAAIDALAVCDDPGANTQTLVALCEKDPAVAAALLRYANAPCYAPAGTSITSLRHAVSRVGVDGVRNVLLDIAVHGLLCQPGPALAPLASAVWAHSVSAAPIARAIARAWGAPAESAYALALLHDVGKLVVLDQISALRTRLGRVPAIGEPVVLDALRRLHQPLGALAAHRWRLGATAAAAIGAHHRDPAPATPDAMSEILYAAERLAHQRRRGESADLVSVWSAGALGGDIARAARALAEECEWAVLTPPPEALVG